MRAKTTSARVEVTSGDYSFRRNWDTEIREYRAARSQGIQPRSTQLKDIRAAVAVSRKLDRAVKES